MRGIPSIKSVMSTFPHWVDRTAPLTDALALMEEHRIRHVPVQEDGRLVGILTEGAVRLALGAAPTTGHRVVADLPIHAAYIVELNTPLDVVVAHMARERLEAALVVKSKRLVGIFTITDACRTLADLLRTFFPRQPGDDAA